jgi:hypothetical protein
MEVQEEMFEVKWREFLREGRTKQYAGSPLESNGKSKRRNDKEKRERSKRRAGVPSQQGRDAFPGKDLLNTNALYQEEDKKKKPNCSPGNPNHRGSDPSKGKPGSFAGKDEPGSWSLPKEVGGSDCERGKLKKLGGKRTQWTKAGKGKSGCGRDGQFLCSDPKVKKWSKDKAVAEMLIAFTDDLLEGDEGVLLDEQGDNCGMCIQNYLKSLNAAIRASKGDLVKKK